MAYPINMAHQSPNYSSRDGAPITMLVLHHTAGSARSSLSWLTSASSKVSAHYLIAKSGTVYQLVLPSHAAWHAGKSAWRGLDSDDIQRQSIGIELENIGDGYDPYPPKQYNACLALCQDLVRLFDITPDFVTRHLDIAIPPGRKKDPAGFPWARFLSELYPPSRDYDVIGLPVYQRPERTGPLWGYLLAGEHVTVAPDGHLVDGRGWIDINGLVTRPQ